MERVKLIAQEVPLQPITEAQAIPQKSLMERDASREEITLLALKKALNAQQTPRQRIVVRRMIVDAYREIWMGS